MVDITRERIRLSPAELLALKGAVGFQLPQFGPRVSAGDIRLSLMHQPWFVRHRIVEIESPGTFPAYQVHCAFDTAGQCGILTGNLVVLNAVVTADPPPRLAAADDAVVYANLIDHWTTESRLGELLIHSLDEIPWFEELDPVEEMLIEDLGEQVGHLMGPLKVRAEGTGFVVEKWLLIACQLIYRELHVSADGHVERRDKVVDTELPCPKGEMWGMVDGRLVPTG